MGVFRRRRRYYSYTAKTNIGGETTWSIIPRNLKIPIFSATFPGCQAASTFDNASIHCSYAADALRVENMNLHPGGKQGMLREAFMHGKGYLSQCHLQRTITTAN